MYRVAGSLRSLARRFTLFFFDTSLAHLDCEEEQKDEGGNYLQAERHCKTGGELELHQLSRLYVRLNDPAQQQPRQLRRAKRGAYIFSTDEESEQE